MVVREIDWKERFKQVLARRVVSPLQGVTFGEWNRLLRQHELTIDREYLARAAFTRIASLKSSIDARAERRRFGERIDATEVERPVFILGHYRNGTTHLQNLFAEDPRLAFPSYHEVSFPNAFLIDSGLRNWIAPRLTMRKRPQDNVKMAFNAPAEDELAMCGTTFLSSHMCWHFPQHEGRYRRYLTFEEASSAERETWKRALLRFARKLTLKSGRQLVFKSPCHTARIPLILEVFPDARFVHINRDPYTVFQSTRHMETKVSPFYQYQRRDFSTVSEFIVWRFRAMYDSYLENRRLIPEGNLIDISYRQLVSDPVPTLQRVYDSLGLETFEAVRPRIERYLSRVNGYERNRYGDLDESTRSLLAREWEPAFEEWGCGSRGDGQAAGSGSGRRAVRDIVRV